MESVCEETFNDAALPTSIVDRLVALGEEGMASGISEEFDIEALIEEDEEDETRASRQLIVRADVATGRLIVARVMHIAMDSGRHLPSN